MEWKVPVDDISARHRGRTIVLRVVDQEAYSWESQRNQYLKHGAAGITYYAGPTRHGNVDCLLWRDARGGLRGILNHYPFTNAWERKGNINIFVDPDYQRTGIGSALLDEARRRWPFDPEQQTYTRQGLTFILSYLQSREL